MAIEHTITIEDDILIVTASGRDENLEQTTNYAMSVLEAAVASGCTRVLCDERQLAYTLSTLDTFKYGEFLAANVPHVARVAIVCHPGMVGDAEFWETVVINRGLQARLFLDLDKAKDWLETLPKPASQG